MMYALRLFPTGIPPIDRPVCERTAELEQVLSLITGIGYVRMEEVPAIPRLPRTPDFTY